MTFSDFIFVNKFSKFNAKLNTDVYFRSKKTTTNGWKSCHFLLIEMLNWICFAWVVSFEKKHEAVNDDVEGDGFCFFMSISTIFRKSLKIT